MPSRCTCNGAWDPDCKRHGEARRAQARDHKRKLWAEVGEILAEAQRDYRAQTGAKLSINRPARRAKALERRAEAEDPTTRRKLSGAHRLEVMVSRPEDWKAQAACRGEDRELFYVEVGQNATEAKAICHGCPVRIQCLEYALAIKEEHGIWGGMNEKERTRYARNRARSQVA